MPSVEYVARLLREECVIDLGENYIKRCVAIAGDTIQIVNTELFVNGKAQASIPEKQYTYTIETSSPLSAYAIEQMGITEISGSGNFYYSPLTEKMVEQFKAMDNVTKIERYVAQEQCFPYSDEYAWTADNMGPLWIPKAGTTIELNTKTWLCGSVNKAFLYNKGLFFVNTLQRTKHLNRGAFFVLW